MRPVGDIIFRSEITAVVYTTSGPSGHGLWTGYPVALWSPPSSVYTANWHLKNIHGHEFVNDSL